MIEKTKDALSRITFVLFIINVIGLLIARGFTITVIENVKKRLE